MQKFMEGTLARSAVLMLVLTVLSIGAWELYLRSRGVTVSFDDGPALWAHKRAMVYEPSDKSTVFIGSSRIKFDLDIDTWERLTGDHAIQLAMEGNSPRLILEHLANDKEFNGKLIIDVTEGLFFNPATRRSAEVTANLNYYDDITPAEKASFVLNKPLESNLVFLDKRSYSISTMLDRLQIPSRPGIMMLPIFPMDFNRCSFDRQSSMTPRFVADTALQNDVKDIWAFFRRANTFKPPGGDTLQEIFISVKNHIDLIKARGGKVLFVRTPSSDPMLKGEQMGFPREKYWDALLKFTETQGFHFQDYPATANFVCPEFSHLSPADAIKYTEALVRILHEEAGWGFVKMPAKRDN